jgi:hypothetical protein
MPLIIVFSPLKALVRGAGLCGKGWMIAFDGLNAGFFIGAEDMNPLLVKVLSLGVQRTDRRG